MLSAVAAGATAALTFAAGAGLEPPDIAEGNLSSTLRTRTPGSATGGGETVQVNVSFQLPVTTLTPAMRATLVNRVAAVVEVAEASIHVVSVVAETTAPTERHAKQTTTCCTVVTVDVTDLTAAEAAAASERLSHHLFQGFPAHESLAAVLPNATSAVVTVFEQVPHPAHRHASLLAVAGCVAIVVLVVIVRSLALAHYERAMHTKISENTDVLVESLPQEEGNRRQYQGTLYRYKRLGAS